MSPMNPRLLRPTTSLHPEAADWQNRVIANGGTVSGSTVRAVSQFCRRIDAAGIRDRFARLNLFCGSFLGALVPLYRSPVPFGTVIGNATDQNTSFISADYLETGASGGIQGGSGKSLNTGVLIEFSAQTDLHMAVYDASPSSGGDESLIGADALNSSPRTVYSIYHVTTASLQFYSGTTPSANYVPGGSRPSGFYVGSNQLNRRDLFRNGVSVLEIASAQTGAGSGNSETYRVFALGRITGGNSFAAGVYTGRMCGYSLGYAINSTQAVSYNDAMQAFQTTLMRQV